MRARIIATAATILIMLAGAASALAKDEGSLTVTMERAQVDTRLGEKFTVRSTVTNGGTRAASGVIAHLNVASLRPGTYVDPEDWSSDRTRYLPTIAPGDSLTISWELQAVSDGSFGVYVALLDETMPGVVAGPAVQVQVASRRTLNPKGMIPVAVGVPVLLAALMVGVRLRRRR